MAINQRKSGAILMYVQIFLSNTIALIYTPFALRMLGQSQYGLFGTVNSFTAYLSLLSLGIGGAYIRWNAKYRAKNDVEGEQRLNGMFFTMFSIITVITLIIGFVLFLVSPYVFGGKFNNSELYDLKLLIIISVLNTALTFFFTPVFSYIQAYEKFLILRIVSIVSIIITPLVNIIILLLGGKAVAISLATLIISAVDFLAYYIYARKRMNIKFVFKGFTFSAFKEIIVFSSFLFLNSITDLLTDSTDNTILAIVSGTTAVAIYTVGHSFKNYFLQFSTAVSSVFAPQVNQLVASTDDNMELTRLMTRIGRVQFYIVSLLLIGYTAIGDAFIGFWAGEDYTDAYLIGLFLLAGAYIPLFQNIGIEIQKAKNKHQVRSVVYLLVAVFNIALTIPFSMLWGGIGAAFATFLCCMGGNVLFMNIYYHRGIGLDMVYFWKKIVRIIPGFLPTIAVCVLVKLFVPINNLWMLLFQALIICAVYLVSVFFISFNEYEKNLFMGPIKKIGAKFKKAKVKES